MKESYCIETAKEAITIEMAALEGVRDRIGIEFTEAIHLLMKTKGKIVLIGIGKSGLICQKISSTLASTGTPAFFLHPSEGVHGDLGILAKGDTVITISNSGETEEIVTIIPIIKRMGLRLIAITGNIDSTIAKLADVVLDISIEKEACPWDLVPTASTTAALALGDAIAITLLHKKGFQKEDFAQLHPGGTLGKRLLLRVGDIMHAGEEMPLVNAGSSMREILVEITTKKLGIAGVLGDDDGMLLGVISDGDLRRALESKGNILSFTAQEIMSENPKTISRNSLATKALQQMEEFSITALFICESSKKKVPLGIIHIHDLLRAGIV